MTATPRQRARAAMRSELADAAFDYLSLHGYESVTVDALATELGISRATFFRYFDSKEEVVVESAAPVVYSLDTQEATLEGCTPDDPLGYAFALLSTTFPPITEQTARLRARVSMITGNPNLGARLAVKRGARQAELARVLSATLNDEATAQICAALSFACLDVAWRTWAQDASIADLESSYAEVVKHARVTLPHPRS